MALLDLQLWVPKLKYDGLLTMHDVTVAPYFPPPPAKFFTGPIEAFEAYLDYNWADAVLIDSLLVARRKECTVQPATA